MRYVLPRIESLPIWPIISAPIFFLLFIGLVYWIYKRSRSQLYEEASILPLTEEDKADKASH